MKLTDFTFKISQQFFSIDWLTSATDRRPAKPNQPKAVLSFPKVQLFQGKNEINGFAPPPSTNIKSIQNSFIILVINTPAHFLSPITLF